jgi:hypothetical protein
MTKKTKYECEICHNVYDEYQKARSCEANCLRDRIVAEEEKRFQEKFPRKHKDDTHYKGHCVKCGTKIFEYERNWDGHRNERGAVIDNLVAGTIFGGIYCRNHYKKRDDHIRKILMMHAAEL